MRFAKLLLVLIGTAATPALADEPAAASSVVVLHGSSAPTAPWYEPPPEPKVVVQPVYVPLYYLPVAYGPFLYRQPYGLSARRNR